MPLLGISLPPVLLGVRVPSKALQSGQLSPWRAAPRCPLPGGLWHGSRGAQCGAVIYLVGPWLLGHSGYICTEAGGAKAGPGCLPAPRQNLISPARPRALRVGRSVVGADGRQLGPLAAAGRAGQAWT